MSEEIFVPGSQIRYPRGNGNIIRVCMRAKTAARLKGTCFRGQELAAAGNFKLWGSFPGMIEDEIIREGLLAELDPLHEQGKFDSTYSLTVKYPHRPVGWSSTICRSRIHVLDSD